MHSNKATHAPINKITFKLGQAVLSRNYIHLPKGQFAECYPFMQYSNLLLTQTASCIVHYNKWQTFHDIIPSFPKHDGASTHFYSWTELLWQQDCFCMRR